MAQGITNGVFTPANNGVTQTTTTATMALVTLAPCIIGYQRIVKPIVFSRCPRSQGKYSGATTLSITTFSIMTLSITTVSIMTLSIIVNKMRHSSYLHSAQGRALLCWVSIMLSYIYKSLCAECRYAECRSATDAASACVFFAKNRECKQSLRRIRLEINRLLHFRRFTLHLTYKDWHFKNFISLNRFYKTFLLSLTLLHSKLVCFTPDLV